MYVFNLRARCLLRLRGCIAGSGGYASEYFKFTHILFVTYTGTYYIIIIHVHPYTRPPACTDSRSHTHTYMTYIHWAKGIWMEAKHFCYNNFNISSARTHGRTVHYDSYAFEY